MTLGEIIARRRKCATTTAGEILCAARCRFLAESYENVGLREIAGDVGVDVALVSRYFGSKDNLFRAVLRAGKDEKFSLDVAPNELPAYLASLVVREGGSEDAEQIEKLLIILRSASSPAASEIVRETVRSDVLEPLARLLGGEHAAERASLILSILFGSTLLRTIMVMEPCVGDGAAMRARLTRLFEAALAV